MDANLYIHIPFELLLDKFDLIAQAKINVEILFSGDILDTLRDRDLDRVKKWMKQNHILCTIHAPFVDMSPGGLDAKVRRVTLERYLNVIQIARELRSRCIVFHPGYNEIFYGNQKERWLANSLQTWEAMLAHSEDLTLCVENVFESHPENLLSLLRALDSSQVGHCFDTGHFNLFGKCSVEDWFDELGPYIREVHLHDNHGKNDDHLAVGEGMIDFERIFALLDKEPIVPELVLEAHSQEQALLAIKRMTHRLDSQPAEAAIISCPN